MVDAFTPNSRASVKSRYGEAAPVDGYSSPSDENERELRDAARAMSGMQSKQGFNPDRTPVAGYKPDFYPPTGDEDVEDDGDASYGGESAGTYVDGPMDDPQFQSIVRQAIWQSQTYIDSYIAPEREAAQLAYLGGPQGDEEEGRSQVVLTEVRDTILAMLPSLLRIFVGGENVVEFVPRGPEDVDAAAQATDTINYIVQEENNAFRVLHDAMKDGLTLKTGVLTWYKLDEEKVEYFNYAGLAEDEVAFLAAQPGISIEDLQAKPVEMPESGMPPQQAPQPPAQAVPGAPMAPPAPQEPVAPPMEYSLRVKRVTKKPSFVIEAVPPEQFLISNSAQSIDDAIYVGRRRLMTVSDLVQMGYDRETVEENAGTGGFEMNLEVLTRNPADQSFYGLSETNDESTRRVFYVESYLRADRDGDGIAELWKVCSVGNGAVILHAEMVNHAPFALLCPDPTPHTIFGQSIADQTMDLQRIKTNIMRNTLDSLAQSIHPRTVVLEGQVNIDDVMNVETGAIIRARTPGAVQALAEPFVGQQALGVMGYVDEIKAQRTGINRTSQGLNADVLQSTTQSAIQAQLTSSQERVEMIARLFADGIRDMFRGLLKLFTQYQDKPKVIRLRGKWVAVDPRVWDADMDCRVNIALGRGSDAQRMGFLTNIAAQQEKILTTLGPMNPLVTLEQYRNTLAEIVRLSGFKDPSRFVKEISPEEVQRMAQAIGQKKPDPAEMLAQVEQQKTQADIVVQASKQELDRQKAMADFDLRRDQMMIDAHLRAADIEAKYGSQVNMAGIRAGATLRAGRPR